MEQVYFSMMIIVLWGLTIYVTNYLGSVISLWILGWRIHKLNERVKYYNQHGWSVEKRQEVLAKLERWDKLNKALKDGTWYNAFK